MGRNRGSRGGVTEGTTNNTSAESIIWSQTLKAAAQVGQWNFSTQAASARNKFFPLRQPHGAPFSERRIHFVPPGGHSTPTARRTEVRAPIRLHSMQRRLGSGWQCAGLSNARG